MPCPFDVRPYDAVLLVSFGGPEGPDDVIGFLENVTAGRDISRKRLAEVGAHYALFGGRSPLNDQCRALKAAVEDDLRAAGIEVPVYWGNRNFDPYLTDTLAEMTDDGVQRAAAFVTSAYSSYSGCRQYRENLFDAVTAAGPDAPRIDRLRHYFNHPGFIEAFVAAALEAIAQLPAEFRDEARLVFVTHSIPTAMNDGSGLLPGGSGGAYVRQHLDAAAAVAARVADHGRAFEHDLAFCSRSGPPQAPWLEPDINDRLEQLSTEGVDAVVVIPIGFVSDHMEVVYDLDTEARETADRLGLMMVRAATPGVAPAFVYMVRQLLLERAATERDDPVERPARGTLGAGWDVCPVGCCVNVREPGRPAVCGEESDFA